MSHKIKIALLSILLVCIPFLANAETLTAQPEKPKSHVGKYALIGAGVGTGLGLVSAFAMDDLCAFGSNSCGTSWKAKMVGGCSGSWCFIGIGYRCFGWCVCQSRGSFE